MSDELFRLIFARWCRAGLHPIVPRPYHARSAKQPASRARVGVTISMYEGTKHSFATDAAARKVPERALQAFLGHRDVRSTRKYARLADEALVDVLRRPKS